MGFAFFVSLVATLFCALALVMLIKVLNAFDEQTGGDPRERGH